MSILAPSERTSSVGADAPLVSASAFSQQRMQAWQPVFKPRVVVRLFLLAGVCLVAIGIALSMISQGVHELHIPYQCADASTTCDLQNRVVIEDTLTGPLFVYVQLENFYQNHRRYMKSRSEAQLAAEQADGASVATEVSQLSSACAPLSESPDQPGKLLYPCGLVARSVYNDYFHLLHKESDPGTFSELAMDERPETIAWEADVKWKYHNLNPRAKVGQAGKTAEEALDMWILDLYPPMICNSKPELSIAKCSATMVADSTIPECDYEGRRRCSNLCDDASTKPRCTAPTTPPQCVFTTECPDAIANPAGWGVENSHFIAWMRPAGLPSFRKLWGRLNVDELKAGSTVEANIHDRFPVASFGGKKSLVISSTSVLGGKNDFLAAAYIVVGVLFLLVGTLFGVLDVRKPRMFGDIGGLAGSH